MQLIVNSQGHTKEVQPPTSHPDKKERKIDYAETTAVLKEIQRIRDAFDIGQCEATWIPQCEYPMLPIAVLLATDMHYGSTRTAYPKLDSHLNTVEETPNFGMVGNGDDVDNFNVTLGRVATGVLEDPLPPWMQGRALTQRLLKIDMLEKIGVLSFGNHNHFAFAAGQDWEDTFLSEFKCPVFVSGGLLHIMHQEMLYNLALTHRYWGTSKLNPNNATRRFVEYEYPQADIAFLGHTHTSSVEHWERGGKDVIGLIGGTYKLDDQYARQHGIGGRSGQPGMTVMLWPNERRMEVFKDIDTAKIVMQALIGEVNHFRTYSHV